MSESDNRKLFLSFTDTLRGLANGTVSEADLERGLFYFGCTRAHAVDPWTDAWSGGPAHPLDNEVLRFFDVEHGHEIHGRLVTALRLAEEEGRAIWRPLDGRQTYADLGQMLERNGFNPRFGGDARLNFSLVAQWVRSARVNLTIVPTV